MYGLIFVAIALFLLYKLNPTNHDKSSPDANLRYALYGARLIDEDFRYFPDWSSHLLDEYEDVDPKLLETLFECSQRVAEFPVGERTAIAEKLLIEEGLLGQKPPVEE